jgi:hypothetical protein
MPLDTDFVMLSSEDEQLSCVTHRIPDHILAPHIDGHYKMP